MNETNDINETLKKLYFKTPRKYIGKDPGSNGYVTARYVMNVLDTVVGPANWSDEYRDLNTAYTRKGIKTR